MKFAVVLLALVSVAFAAPQPRKVFHENFEDFVELITQEAGDALGALIIEYAQYDEFLDTVDYVRTANFKNLVLEMEDLPEFKAVTDFLETHSVDISYFIDMINELISYEDDGEITHTGVNGNDFTAYIRDSIDLFPKEKLAALFDQKLAEDADFKAAIEGLESEEFIQLFDALWENSVFQAEIKTLEDNGIPVDLLFAELVAIFGQDVLRPE